MREPMNRPGEPPASGLLTTFCGQPLVLDPAGLQGVDVAVLGAPFDEGTSHRPGTRFGPRAIRAADDGGRHGRPHMTLGVDPLEALAVVDYGDVEATPSDLERSHERLALRLREILAAGAIPLVLGGDHSLSLPTLRVLAERFGPGGYAVLHLDTHADTATELYGVRVSHGTPFGVALEEGSLLGANLVQVGLRGTWPGPELFDWMRGQGVRWHTMDSIVERGLAAVVEEALEAVAAAAPRAYLTVDIDVLDPAFAPGTGTPEPGGLTTRELLWAVRACRPRARPLRCRRGRGLAAVRPCGRDRPRRRANRARDPGRHRGAAGCVSHPRPGNSWLVPRGRDPSEHRRLARLVRRRAAAERQRAIDARRAGMRELARVLEDTADFYRHNAERFEAQAEKAGRPQLRVL